MKKDFKIFVISALKATERRASISKQLDELGLAFEFVDAFYLNAEEAQTHLNTAPSSQVSITKPLAIGEVGCSLSHIEAYKRMLANDLPYALIIEDDAIIDNKLLELINNLKNIAFDVVIAGRSKLSAADYQYSSLYFPVTRHHKFESLVVGYPIKLRKYGTVGYFISHSAAKQMIELNFPINTVADDWPYFGKTIDIKEARPLVIYEDYQSFGSDIMNTRGGSLRIRHQSLRRHLGRLLRGFVQRLQLNKKGLSKPAD